MVLLLSAKAKPSSLVTDSLYPDFHTAAPGKAKSFINSYPMVYIGVPLVLGGLVVKKEDHHFRSLRNDYMPSFRRNFDDYLQYLPAAVMLGLKAGGVQGRSSWGRTLTSDAFSCLLMGAIVNTLKETASVKRPDGSNNHSFPSGHTATAFMTATMLSKEYGDRSAWISVGAYTTATATGLMRMANNKHWLSDVMVGAGIGILSTEMGYFLADLIFKEKGLNYPVTREEYYNRMQPPSFIGLYLGFNVPLSHFDLTEQLTFKTSSGSTSGLEGAYFFNPYIGIGGRLTVSNVAIIVNENSPEDETFDIVSGHAGGYFSYPLSSRFQLGSKLLAGYTHYPKLILSELTVNSDHGASFGSGISLSFKARPKIGLRLFLDYNLLPPQSVSSKEYMHTLTLGGMAAIIL